MLLPNGVTRATARSAISLAETLPVIGKRILRSIGLWMFSFGNVSLRRRAQRLQILFDIDAVDRSLAVTRPDDYGGCAGAFGVQQYFPCAYRDCVNDGGIARGYLPDVGRVIQDDALAYREPHLFHSLGQRASGGERHKDTGSG